MMFFSYVPDYIPLQPSVRKLHAMTRCNTCGSPDHETENHRDERRDEFVDQLRASLARAERERDNALIEVEMMRRKLLVAVRSGNDEISSLMRRVESAESVLSGVQCVRGYFPMNSDTMSKIDEHFVKFAQPAQFVDPLSPDNPPHR